jgi:hypothetical protein
MTERQEQVIKDDLQKAHREVSRTIETRAKRLWDALDRPTHRAPSVNAEEAKSLAEQFRFLGELIHLYDWGKYDEAYALLETWGE